MPITITSVPGRRLANREVLDVATLNLIGQPSLVATGALEITEVGTGAIDAENVVAGPNYVGTSVFAPDTYEVTLTATPASPLIDGTWVRFIADAGFAGVPVDVTIMGCVPANVPLRKAFNQELEIGDIRAGQPVDILYDGTQWQFMSPPTRRHSHYGGTASGTDSNVSIEIGPVSDAAAGAELIGRPVVFKAVAFNATPLSVNVSNNGVFFDVGVPVIKLFTATSEPGDVVADAMPVMIHDGVQFQTITAPAGELNNAPGVQGSSVRFGSATSGTIEVSWNELTMADVNQNVKRYGANTDTLNFDASTGANALLLLTPAKTALQCYHIYAIGKPDGSADLVAAIAANLAHGVLPAGGYTHLAYLGAACPATTTAAVPRSMALGARMISVGRQCYVQQRNVGTSGIGAQNHGLLGHPSVFRAALGVVANDAATGHLSGAQLAFDQVWNDTTHNFGATSEPGRIISVTATQINYQGFSNAFVLECPRLSTGLMTVATNTANFELRYYAIK